MQFKRKELTEVVKPYRLKDVLKSLQVNGYISSYRVSEDTVYLEVPENVSIAHVRAGFEQVYNDKTKKKETH